MKKVPGTILEGRLFPGQKSATAAFPFRRPYAPARRSGATPFWALFLALACLLLAPALHAQNADFARGEDLFLRNRPAEAAGYLEKAAAAEPANIAAALYLAMAYEQLGKTDSAIAEYRRILPIGGAQTALIAFNLGNAYFSKGQAAFAEQCYGKAIEADPGYASAYLNRANTRVKAGAIKDAIPDYELYLELEPASPKRAHIERLISLIEEQAAAAEKRRLAAEAAAKAEAEKRQKLLDELAAALRDAAEDTKGLKSGAEDVSGYEGEFELE